MTRVVVDDVIRDKLLNFAKPIELCDEQGNLLARVLPNPSLADYGPLEPQISEDELRRRASSTGPWYTTAEVLAHLKSLEGQ